MTTICFRAPKFFSELDEELFFIGLRLVTLSDDDDTELAALLRRFKVKRVD